MTVTFSQMCLRARTAEPPFKRMILRGIGLMTGPTSSMICTISMKNGTHGVSSADGQQKARITPGLCCSLMENITVLRYPTPTAV